MAAVLQPTDPAVPDPLRLEGIHHITAITGDARRNLDFYTRVLGLRLVAKTVNQDDPGVYHLFYADEQGRPGSELTFFEYPGAIPGRPGAGMVHTIVSRVGGPAALDFWEQRLGGEGVETERSPATRCASPTSRACATSWPCARASTSRWPPSIRRSRPSTRSRASTACAPTAPTRSAAARCWRRCWTPGRSATPPWELRGQRRGGTIEFEPAPADRGRQSAGTVHHVAWGTTVDEHPRWFDLLQQVGVPNSGIIDRHYFHSIYFREPSGVLFEIADDGPGFTVDVPLEQLGSVVILPPQLEPRRAEIEQRLTPLPDPRVHASG